MIYGITYVPNGNLVWLQTLIIFSLNRNIKFHQINIKSAFLNAPLKEDIYLNPLQGVSFWARIEAQEVNVQS